MDNESLMLGCIRAALGREAVSTAPEPLPAFLCDDAVAPETNLVELFSDELEMAGGTVASVHSPDEIKSYLRNLLPSTEPVTVAVSDGVATQQPWLCAWLKSLNVHVVPSFKQFVETRSERAGKGHSPSSANAGSERTLEEYKDALLDADLGLTLADYALAETGTLALVSGGEQHRLISLLPPLHVCLLEPNRLVANLSDLMRHVQIDCDWRERPPLAMTLITGPSRTADIEQTITNGVHGPREVHVLLCSP